MHRSTLLPAVLVVSAVAASLIGPSRAWGADREGELPRAMAFARKTLDFVQASAPRPKLAAELAGLEARAQAADALGDADRKALFGEVLRLRRQIILSHPLLGFDRLLINKRTSRIPGHMCDQYYGRHSTPGPGLVILENWKDAPKEVLLLKDKLPPGMTMHPDLSFDAERVLFGFCDHSKTAERNQLSFFIYELTLATGEVKQLTGTKADRFVGFRDRRTVLIEDWDPCYLPDGGFAFISTRSQQFGRCHGSRYVPSYVLYRADAGGANIRQISVNEANEWDPAVLHDGRIIYCRWDYINRHDTNFQSLWVTRPDGIQTAHFYGNYSVGPCMIAEAHAIPGSHKVVANATDHHGYTAGSIIVIDPYKGEDGGEPLLCVTPEIGFPERAAPPGTTMAPPPFTSPLAPPDRRGRGRGRAATPFPLSEDLFLMAYPHGGQFAIYLVDTLGGRELIHYDPAVSCFAPIPIQPTVKPPAIPDYTVGKEPVGRFFVEDVYQSTQPIERGTIRRLRINEIISQATRAKPALSYVNNEVIKRILGTVPVKADGSVAFSAPADIPLQFQLLDANGMAVMTMRSLVYVRPGETAGCVGCHEPRHATPGARRLPAPMQFHRLDPPAGPRYDGGLSFARTVQPVLDRYCIGCHGLGEAPKAPEGPVVVAAPKPEPPAPKLPPPPPPKPQAAPKPKPKSPEASELDKLMEVIAAGRGKPGGIAEDLAKQRQKALPKPAPAPQARPAPRPREPAVPSGKAAGGVWLIGSNRGRYNAAYQSIMRRPGMVTIAQRNRETVFSKPKDYFAHAGKLTQMLLAGHPDPQGRPRVRLDADSLQRIIDWLDLNAQYYGDYSFNRAEDQPPDAEGEKALREYVAKRFGPKLAQQPFDALVNVALPTQSRILQAPLAGRAGGWGQIDAGAWADTNDPAYREMLRLVRAAITAPAHQDLAGTCNRTEGCRCGCCWVRAVRAERTKHHQEAVAVREAP